MFVLVFSLASPTRLVVRLLFYGCLLPSVALAAAAVCLMVLHPLLLYMVLPAMMLPAIMLLTESSPHPGIFMFGPNQ